MPQHESAPSTDVLGQVLLAYVLLNGHLFLHKYAELSEHCVKVQVFGERSINFEK